MLVDDEPDMRVVAEAGDGAQALAAVRHYRPDVAIMDIRMPVLDGLTATRQIVEAGLPTKVLILTTFDLDEYVFEALRAGASGFLVKDAPAEKLVEGVHVVASGEALLAPTVARRVVERFSRLPAARPELAARLGARPHPGRHLRVRVRTDPSRRAGLIGSPGTRIFAYRRRQEWPRRRMDLVRTPVGPVPPAFG